MSTSRSAGSPRSCDYRRNDRPKYDDLAQSRSGGHTAVSEVRRAAEERWTDGHSRSGPLEQSVMKDDSVPLLDLCQVERRDRRSAWENVMAERLVPMGIDISADAEGGGHGLLRSLDLSDIKVTEWDCPTLKVSRTKRLIETSNTEVLMLLTASSGTQHFELQSGTARMGPGTGLISTGRVAYKSTVSSGLRKRSVVIPLSALASYDTGGSIPDCVMLDQSRPLARVLISFVESMGSHVSSMDAADAEAAREALLTLVAGVIRSSTRAACDGPTLLPALRSQLDQWIKQHLRSGPIRVADMARAFNVSSRTVHRAFSLTGDTVGSVVRMQRLASARRDVVATDIPIGSIAHRWGFYDASHFGREFRKFLSMSPSDYRECFGIASVEMQAETDTLNPHSASTIDDLAS
ncbi:AraC family transcriptional regulator [Rhodococcus sp. USK13]|uniref:AraC family transcriptional regulator n=1 Tax=Rhodococcus sp. USK13 TaxID=2806442 RepID=UPI0020181DA7|nr:AraC family transcriptional regulator [Rhodococcus sp. USK13]